MNTNNINGLNNSMPQSIGPASSAAADRATRTGNDRPVTSGNSVDDLQYSKVIQATVEELMRISEDLQRRVRIVAPELHFSVDQSTERMVIKVMDRATNSVIRQIPSNEALLIDQQLDQYAQSLLLDHRA